MNRGIVLPQGITHVRKQLPHIVEDLNNGLSLCARDYLSKLYGELVDCDALVAKYEARIKTFAMNNEDCKRLQKIPGVGPLTATAIVAHVGTAKHFKNGRAFAACMGLTPREHSSGGKQKLLGITKRGNSHIRWLLIQGARIITRYSLQKLPEQAEQRIRWVQELVARRGKHVAAVALANKTARTIWALLARGEEYRPSFA